MILAKDEVVIKSWDYAHGKTGLDNNVYDSNLTITNKRVINSVESKVSLSVSEVPIKSIKCLNGSYRKNKSLLATIQLIIGIPLCLVIIGIFMIKSALNKLRACYLDLEIVTEGAEGTTLHAGAAGAVNSIKKDSFFSRIFKLKKKVFVKKEVAKEILETIGAVIIENK